MKIQKDLPPAFAGDTVACGATAAGGARRGRGCALARDSCAGAAGCRGAWQAVGPRQKLGQFYTNIMVNYGKVGKIISEIILRWDMGLRAS